MKSIYIFSGLGTDERVFKNLEFPGYKVIFIKWIIPLKNETLKEYAQRLIIQIKASNPLLIGLSFGGIVAKEVSEIIKIEKLILIASVKTSNEIPFYFRIAGKLNLHRLIPSQLFTHHNFIGNWFFGLNRKSDKILLGTILRDMDREFVKWAINAIVKWNCVNIHKNTILIHGTSDRIFPYRSVRADYPIANGGHFMTVNKATEINRLLKILL